MSTEKKLPTLGYWNIRGYGQPIRFLLKYLEVDYDEVTYSCTTETMFSEWDAVKGSLGLDFPNLPYWIDGDVKLSESRAILKYLCQENEPGLLPDRNESAFRNAEMLDGIMTDVWHLLGRVTYFNSPETVDDYAQNAKKKLGQVSTFITKLGGPWCLGEKLSYLDFLFYEILFHNLAFEPTLLDDLPDLQDHMRQFEEIPQIAKFINSDECIKGPCFRPWAKVTI